MSRVVGEPALVLHLRPYRETSAIVSMLTLHHGRVAAVARGARGRKGGSLQPFNRIRASWQGRGNLVTLVGAEPETHIWLQGDALAAGFYVLELVSRLLGERESAPRVYAGACWTLECLRDGTPAIDIVLRQFELLLLAELGYGLDFGRDALSGEPIDPEGQYRFEAQSGFARESPDAPGTYTGQVLLDIQAANYVSRVTRTAAKRILRLALAPLLGVRPLASRQLLLRLPG